MAARKRAAGRVKSGGFKTKRPEKPNTKTTG